MTDIGRKPEGIDSGAHILWVLEESVMPILQHSERGIFYNHSTKNLRTKLPQ